MSILKPFRLLLIALVFAFLGVGFFWGYARNVPDNITAGQNGDKALPVNPSNGSTYGSSLVASEAESFHLSDLPDKGFILNSEGRFDCGESGLCASVLGSKNIARSSDEAAWLEGAGFPTAEEINRLATDDGEMDRLLRLAQRGDLDAAALLGAVALSDHDIEEAEAWLRQAEISCSPFVFRQLGHWYLANNSVERMDSDFSFAYQYFRMAYLSGDIEAARLAGELIEESEKVRVSMSLMDQAAMRLLAAMREEFPQCRRQIYVRPEG